LSRALRIARRDTFERKRMHCSGFDVHADVDGDRDAQGEGNEDGEVLSFHGDGPVVAMFQGSSSTTGDSSCGNSKPPQAIVVGKPQNALRHNFAPRGGRQ
jgi:hypothetical protein